MSSPPSSLTSSSSTSLFNHLPSPDPYNDSFIDLIYPHQDEKFYIGDLLSPSIDPIRNTDEFYCVKLANVS